MFRRRPTATDRLASRPTTATAPALGVLAEAGWVLPTALAGGARPAEPAWTLVGTVGSGVATAVDPTGLVVGEGWSLDWWIGADDRWHVPAREAAVRQGLLDDAPVVETLLRIPGGDAVHRAFGIRAARGVGDEWVVAEVENRTPVPLAVAMVVRPFVADAVGVASEITIHAVDGGRGPDVAHLVRVDGVPAVVVPRRPARIAVGSRASGDLLDAILDERTSTDLESASCADGLATLAMIFPVPHTARLRVLLPVGEVEGTEAVAYPAVVPDADVVASGWEVHRRGPRVEVPDRRVQRAVVRAQAQLHLAHDGATVRRDGRVAPDLEPGATEVLLGAFDVLDRPAEVGSVIARWPDRLQAPSPAVDALVLTAVSRHWRLHRIDALLDWMLPEVAAAVERLDRAHRKGRLGDRLATRRAARALDDAADLLVASGQHEAAASVRGLSERIDVAGGAGDDTSACAATRLDEIGRRLAAGDDAALSALDAVVATASATGAWSGPGPGGRAIGHDLAAEAALVLAVRALLVSERTDGLALLPVFPAGWYGGAIELHDAPTASGVVSFAVRWHGTRPALLWELEPHPRSGPVTLTAPGLDPAWSTTDLRGEALLAVVPPPEGLAPLQVVAEHPDIDPVMRRPGGQPGEPPAPLPEGGTFS